MRRRTTHASHSSVVIAAFGFLATACAHHDATPLTPEAPLHHTRSTTAAAAADSGPPIVFADAKRVLVKNAARGGWQVSFADAMRADGGAGELVRMQHPEIFAKLTHYVAQIFGVTNDDGHKLVEMSFMCNVTLTPASEDVGVSPAPTAVERDMAALMMDGPATCRDGGDCCFQLYFDPVTGSYGPMLVNGR
ncbi:MAG: hypothetical protein ABI183_14570 [Polyangiaceae bacterium]